MTGVQPEGLINRKGEYVPPGGADFFQHSHVSEEIWELASNDDSEEESLGIIRFLARVDRVQERARIEDKDDSWVAKKLAKAAVKHLGFRRSDDGYMRVPSV